MTRTSILSGLHAAFLLFHNHAVDHVKSQGRPRGANEVFNRARQLTIWHYQWMVLHEFLPLFVGQSMVDRILSQGRKFYMPRRGRRSCRWSSRGPRIASVTSMVRPSYRANLAGDLKERAIFRHDLRPRGPGETDLRSGEAASGGSGTAPICGLADILRLRTAR